MQIRLIWTGLDGRTAEEVLDNVTGKGEAINQWAQVFPLEVEADIWPKSVVIINCCGDDLDCDAFTVTCDACGADYNMSGHRLAPRDQWGEETGEHWSECY